MSETKSVFDEIDAEIEAKAIAEADAEIDAGKGVLHAKVRKWLLKLAKGEMTPRIVKVAALAQYRLHVEFDDGVAGTIDLSEELDGEVFQPLRDEAIFRQVMVDKFGAVCWPNGPGLAPDAVRGQLARVPAARRGSDRRSTPLAASRTCTPPLHIAPGPW